MKTCAAWREELAVFATDGVSPNSDNADARAHFERCAECQKALGELRKAAAIHIEMGAKLAVSYDSPRRLESWFAEKTRHRDPKSSSGVGFWTPRWPPYLGATAALLTMLLVVTAVVLRTSRELPQDRVPLIEQPPSSAVQAAMQGGQATWQAYRQELQHGSERMAGPISAGGAHSHYRMKDAYSELN